jgi:PEP-CTERM motif
MIHFQPIVSKFPGLSLTALVIGVFLSSEKTSEAALTLDSSVGTISYGIFSTTLNTNSPAFSNSMLIYPGGGLPVLTEGALSQNSSSALSPFFFSNATTNPGSPVGSVPPIYGNATTEVYTSTSGQQGGFTTQGGVFWSLRTSLADNLPSVTLSSVMFSTASSTFTNNTGGNISLNPGAILSVTGSLGRLDGSSYVAAGLATSFTVFGAGVPTSSTLLDPIILATNGHGTNIATTGTGPHEFASLTVSGNRLTGTATSFGTSSITLISGESITIAAALTLISDPGSSIGLTTDLTPGFPSGPQFVPTFGAFADSRSVVPEPSTIVLLGGGLAMAGLWTRSNRRRTLTTA